MPLLLQEKIGSFAILQLNRPEKLNALSQELMTELHQSLLNLAADDELRCLILTATGDRAFCAGTDIAELVNSTGAAVAQRGLAICELVNDFPVPVIGAINGLAAGGGCELVLACHLRIASSHAEFSLPETKLGLIPGYGGTQRLAREIGISRAVEIMLTGRRLAASEAEMLGMVNRVVQSSDLLSAAKTLAEEISSLAPLAVRACLRAVVDGVELTLVDGLALETSLFSQLFDTEDMREGTQAFLEKRQPRFEGR